MSWIEEAFGAVENFVGLDGNEEFRNIKSMFRVWNPKSSKWATGASKRYKEAVRKRTSFPDAWKPLTEDETTWRTARLKECNCSRRIKGHKNQMVYDGTEGNSSVSTCAEHSFLRGFKQRVIGFSFYGDPKSVQFNSRKYFYGIRNNLKLVPKSYPGWNIRLYHDMAKGSPLMKELCGLACNDPNIDLCDVTAIPMLGNVSRVFAMNWRFLPMLDPQVTHLVSRDLDSIFTARETAAVNDWLADDSAAFHFMRDHPSHRIEVLGSGWGVRMGAIERELADDAFSAALKDPLFWAARSSYGADQGFLKRFIWPWGRWSAISHDSHTCAAFPRTRAFPTQRLLNETNNFVAAVVVDGDILKVKCPLRCRPKNHPDWEYC